MNKTVIRSSTENVGSTECGGRTEVWVLLFSLRMSLLCSGPGSHFVHNSCVAQGWPFLLGGGHVHRIALLRIFFLKTDSYPAPACPFINDVNFQIAFAFFCI